MNAKRFLNNFVLSAKGGIKIPIDLDIGVLQGAIQDHSHCGDLIIVRQLGIANPHNYLLSKSRSNIDFS